jgi:hypothetical protein
LAVQALVLAAGFWDNRSELPNSMSRKGQGEMMKGTDKFLIGIVTGIVLLVVVVFLVVLLRPEPEYLDEKTPEDVAHNYLLALQKGDYERALGNLSSSVVNVPKDVDEFIEDIDNCSWRFRDLDRDTSLIVVSADIRGERAEVQIKQTVFYSGDMFDSDLYESEFEMTLKQQNDVWKLINGDNYWCYCWNEKGGCR